MHLMTSIAPATGQIEMEHWVSTRTQVVVPAVHPFLEPQVTIMLRYTFKLNTMASLPMSSQLTTTPLPQGTTLPPVHSAVIALMKPGR